MTPIARKTLSFLPAKQCGVTTGMLAQDVFGNDDEHSRRTIRAAIHESRAYGVPVLQTDSRPIEFWLGSQEKYPVPWFLIKRICDEEIEAENSPVLER